MTQGNFSWLPDLEDAGYEAADITSLLIDTANPGPWVIFDNPDIHPHEGEVDINLHQPVCAHNRRSTDTKGSSPFDT